MRREISHEPATVRYVAYQLVASTPDGKPVYTIADIIEPLPQFKRDLLRSARLIAGYRGYVLVGCPYSDWADFEMTARRIEGILPSTRKGMGK